MGVRSRVEDDAVLRVQGRGEGNHDGGGVRSPTGWSVVIVVEPASDARFMYGLSVSSPGSLAVFAGVESVFWGVPLLPLVGYCLLLARRAAVMTGPLRVERCTTLRAAGGG